MREQKQLEFSLTQELISQAIPQYEGLQRETLERDTQTLEAMENDAERFAQGVGLDSVSTFECIVEGFDHFFMEMNTRIQVEHGVTELAYLLRFTNPDNPDEFFYLDRLIEAMALLSFVSPTTGPGDSLSPGSLRSSQKTQFLLGRTIPSPGNHFPARSLGRIHHCNAHSQQRISNLVRPTPVLGIPSFLAGCQQVIDRLPVHLIFGHQLNLDCSQNSAGGFTKDTQHLTHFR